MPDPQVLYIVTGIVILGLIIWVVLALVRAGGEEKPQGALPGAAKPAPRDAEEKKASTAEAPPKGDAPKAAVASPASTKSPSVPAPPAAADDQNFSVETEDSDDQTGPVALILVTAVGLTDPGLKRKHNEDAYAILEEQHLFVIADGMGRHAAGEIASQLCVDAIRECFQNDSFASGTPDSLPKRGERIRDAILTANTRILEAANANESYAGMGTTVVSAYFSPNNQRVYIAHVGDSRCYRLRNGKLSQLTMDHTLGAAGIQGKSAGILSRAVGVEENVEVDVSMEAPLPRDIYLLCSDGLSRMMKDEEIQAAIEAYRNDLEGATKRLIELANERGGRDNITTILVRVDDAMPALSSASLPAAR